MNARSSAPARGFIVAFLLTFAAACSHGAGSAQSAGEVAPGQVEVVVFGSPHLRQMDEADRPTTDGVLRELERFEPDLVVVEWLHPSIDPATTGNYRPFTDRAGLARSWGIDLGGLDSAIARVRAQIESAEAADRDADSLRIGLGKLLYLSGDRLNAGYQWWLAERGGAQVDSLKPLTSDNFEGHELEVWGFPVAQAQGHEYLTPFDYQGDDAAWNWDEIVERVAVYLISERHGIEAGDSGWEAAVERYGALLGAQVAQGDSTWVREYGAIPEAREFLDVVTIWTARRAAEGPEPERDGLAMMRRLQSPEHIADKRRMYDDVFPRISLDGLGRRLVDNWLRRNERMVDFVEQDIRRLDARKVLILVGEGHKPFLDDELRERGYEVVSAAEVLR